MAEGFAVGLRFVSAVLLLLWLAAGRTSAQPAASAAPLGDLLVPGGLARLFHAAGLRPPRDRAYALPALSRLVYPTAEGDPFGKEDGATRLREYLDVVGQWSMRAAPFTNGLSLRDAAAGKARGQLEDLLAFIGLELSKGGGARHVVPGGDPDARRRRALLSAAGMDLDDFAARLNAGATVQPQLAGDTVPLPLSGSTWLRAIFENRVPEPAMFALIIGEREALWLYCGLLALDPETRRFMESEPELLAWIYRNRAMLFGAFGRSFRVANGRVQTPGEARDVALWESFVGAPASQPRQFLRRVLQADAGRLAWFYDTIEHLPPERRAALGPALEADAAARVAWVRSLYSVFVAFNPAWDIAAQPFVQRFMDPSLALHLIDVKPGGRVAGPAWLAVWEHALATGERPDRPPEVLGRLDAGKVASLPWVLGQVFAVPARDQRAVLDRVLFAGRMFEGIDERRAFDALVALRGFSRAPALMLVLERMGLRDPEVLAEAARAAEVISAADGARPLVHRVVQFQGALALLERLREVHALDAATATTLARRLFAARPAADGWYQGAIVAWLDRQLLPALDAGEGAGPAEARLMIALAGMPRLPGESGPAVEWKGQPYRVHLGPSALTRLLRVREKQGGPTLDALVSAWQRLAAPSEGRVEDLGEDLGPREASTLLGPPLSAADPWPRKVDRAAAEWLASVAYAVRIDNADATILLGANPALNHDLRILAPRLGPRGETAWSLPREVAGGERGTHLEGSLFGLAIPLARHSVVRVKTGMPAHPPTVPSGDVALAMASVATFNALDVTDEERDLIAAAIRRGRERVSALSHEPGEWNSVAGALRADEWERQLMPWMLSHEPERMLARFSAHDLFILGGGGSGERVGRWGILGQPVDGSLIPKAPVPALRRLITNSGGFGILLTQFCDLHFRVAEFLADSRLPALLAGALLAVAVPEFLERAELSHRDDWPGLVDAARITDARFGEYVSALTTGGPLVRQAGPAPQGVGGGGPGRSPREGP